MSDSIKKLSENKWLLRYTISSVNMQDNKKKKDIEINFDSLELNQVGIWTISEDSLGDLTNDTK
jgi:hypothetical protein|tara:strand:- start:850 stop:1041 length:192 start_codon:yes stop_codon:yes gene_type:complete